MPPFDHSPKDDLAAALAPVLTPARTVNTDLFAGPEIPAVASPPAAVIPVDAIFIDPNVSDGSPLLTFRRKDPPNEAILQVMIRGPKGNDFDSPYAVAQDVFAALHLLDVPVLADTTKRYQSVTRLQSSPTRIEKGDDDLHRFTINVMMRYDPRV